VCSFRFLAAPTAPFGIKQDIDLVLRRTGVGPEKKNFGSTFDSWLRDEKLYEEVITTAMERVVARQVAAAMEQKGITKAENGATHAYEPRRA
jgi:hypothetical protein